MSNRISSTKHQKRKVDIYESHNSAVEVRPTIKCTVSTKSVRNLRIFACSNGFLSIVFTDGRSLKSYKYMHTSFLLQNANKFTASALLIKRLINDIRSFNVFTITSIHSSWSVTVTKMLPRVSGKQLCNKTAQITAVLYGWRWIIASVHTAQQIIT